MDSLIKIVETIFRGWGWGRVYESIGYGMLAGI